MSPPGDHHYSSKPNGQHTLGPSHAPEEARSLLFSADHELSHSPPPSSSPSPLSTPAGPPSQAAQSSSSGPFPPPPHPLVTDPAANNTTIAAGADDGSHAGGPAKRPSNQHMRRQSSLSKPPPDGAPKTPRTLNRVRFDLGSSQADQEAAVNHFADSNGHGHGHVSPRGSHSPTSNGSRWWPLSPRLTSPFGSSKGDGDKSGDGDDKDGDEEDEDDWDDHWGVSRSDMAQRERLLEGIEAPSVRVANSLDMGARYGGRGDLQGESGLHPGAGGEEASKSGLGSAFMNMANSIIGAGIIAQPYAFQQAGLAAGTVLLVGLTVLVDWTIQLIVVNCKLSGASSYQATMEKCFGKAGLVAISLTQWAFAYGGMLAFCVIVGDTIPEVMGAVWPGLEGSKAGWILVDRRFVVIFLVLGVSWPLSLYRDISKLAKASTLALISMLIILITVITQGVRVDSADRGSLRGSLGIKSGIFQAIGVISFAFVCHHNSLLIYGSLQTPTLDRFAKVTHFSTGISMVACLTMAFAGFLTFGDKTEGNVLNNFPRDNLMVNIARLCFGLNMLTTLPLEAFVCREVMLNYFHPTSPHSTPRHFLYTTVLVVSCVLLSLMTCDLGAVLELIGATSACAIAYIMPPLCYIKLSSRTWRTWVAWCTVAFGICVLGVSSALAIKSLVSGEGSGKTCR